MDMKDTLKMGIILVLAAMMVFCLNATFCMNGYAANYNQEKLAPIFRSVQEDTSLWAETQAVSPLNKMKKTISASTSPNTSSNMSIPRSSRATTSHLISRATTLQPIEEGICCNPCYRIAPGMTLTALDYTLADAAKRYNDGSEKFKMNDYTMAATKYAEAIEIIKKALAAMWYNRGCALYYGQKDQALLCFEKALEINPNYKNATLNRDQILRELKRDGT